MNVYYGKNLCENATKRSIDLIVSLGIKLNMNSLFVYGVLSDVEIISALLERSPCMMPDEVSGYQASSVSQTGWSPFPVMLESKESVVNGYVVYNLIDSDFNILDAFECVKDSIFIRSDITSNLYGKTQAYFPTKVMLRDFTLGEYWALDSIVSVKEEYLKSVIPSFKKEFAGLYKGRPIV